MMTLQSSRLQAHSANTSSGSEVESVHVGDEGESMPAMSFDWSNDVINDFFFTKYCGFSWFYS